MTFFPIAVKLTEWKEAIEAVEPDVIREADLCPACGSASMRTLFHGTDRLFATTTNFFEVVECTDCRLMRLFPQPTAAEFWPPERSRRRLREARAP